MIAGIIFIAVGFLLVFLEFFLPGGIMGIAGALIAIVGLVLFAVHSPYIWLTLLVVILSVIGIVILARFALKRVRSTEKHDTIFLGRTQMGFRASKFSEDLVGREGEVFADLKPAGHIVIEGKRYQAVSRGRFLEKGKHIVVVSGEGAHLIVKEKKE